MNEPDSSLSMFCPHCDSWYNPRVHPGLISELYVDDETHKVVEKFYCPNHKPFIQLLDAAAVGELTPWQEWKRDQLIEEMNSYNAAAARIEKELNDYYMYEDGRFM